MGFISKKKKGAILWTLQVNGQSLDRFRFKTTSCINNAETNTLKCTSRNWWIRPLFIHSLLKPCIWDDTEEGSKKSPGKPQWWVSRGTSVVWTVSTRGHVLNRSGKVFLAFSGTNSRPERTQHRSALGLSTVCHFGACCRLSVTPIRSTRSQVQVIGTTDPMPNNARSSPTPKCNSAKVAGTHHGKWR